jgi:hypothetical protein
MRPGRNGIKSSNKLLKIRNMKYQVLIVDNEFDDMFDGCENYPIYEIEAESIEKAFEKMKSNYPNGNYDSETYSIEDCGTVYMLSHKTGI